MNRVKKPRLAAWEEDLGNTIHTISHEFISSKPYEEVLTSVCRHLAGFVRTFTAVDADVWYIFPNPKLSETRMFRFAVAGALNTKLTEGGPWKSEWNEIHHFFSNEELEHLCALIHPTFSAAESTGARDYVAAQLRKGRTFAMFSLSRFEVPMGYVLLPVPQDKIDKDRLFWCLYKLQRESFGYFEAFYQATNRTYLPSFYQKVTKPVAILFCDLRNSTTVFQVLRIGGEKHIRRFIVFLKAYMELAAEYIVSSGLGTMYGFTGDGIMATFGDHIVPKDENPAKNHAAGASALALFAAERLFRGFQHLYSVWRSHGVQLFDIEYNEDVDLRLGIGLAYGQVHFDEFGSCRNQGQDGSLTSGLLYYNVVGDHMNVASRLSGVAHSELSAVDIVQRPADGKPQYLATNAATYPSADLHLDYLAPIIATKPLALSVTEHLLNSQPSFMTVRLKGIGNRLPVLEIWPKNLEMHLPPQDAASLSEFPPERVASLMQAVTQDQYYAAQVREVGAREVETLRRLVDRLKNDLEAIR